MSEWEIPHGLKLVVGSAVKVVTTVAAREKLRGSKKHKDEHKDYKENKEKDECKDHKDCKELKDHKDFKGDKNFGDIEGVFTGIVLDEAEINLNRDQEKRPQAKEDGEKKDNPPLSVKEDEQFLVLSLQRLSPPFSAGQIVWINVERIVALTIINSK